MNIILDLLWYLLFWHALAKLRLHTESTLEIMEAVTSLLGKSTRQFARACKTIETCELPAEVGARVRRDARVKSKQQEKTTSNKAAKEKAAPAPTRKGKGKSLPERRDLLSSERRTARSNYGTSISLRNLWCSAIRKVNMRGLLSGTRFFLLCIIVSV